MKEQRGFRLEVEMLKRVDDYCSRMELSYNTVVTQCVRMAFPVIESETYYRLKLLGWTPERLGEEFRKFMEGLPIRSPTGARSRPPT